MTMAQQPLRVDTAIQTKGKQRNGPGWMLVLEYKLPGSKFETTLYGQDWAMVEGWEPGQRVCAVIRKGNLKQDKDPQYDSSYFWDLIELLPPDNIPSSNEPETYPYERHEGPETFTPPSVKNNEWGPNTGVGNQAANLAVEMFAKDPAGYHDTYAGYDAMQMLRILRDLIYHEVLMRPIAPEHFCYEHQVDRFQGKTGWGHLRDNEAPCMEHAPAVPGSSVEQQDNQGGGNLQLEHERGLSAEQEREAAAEELDRQMGSDLPF